MLSLRLLGHPELLLDGQPLSVSRRQYRALLYYLAAQPGPVQRDRLLSLFWPDHERPAAQQALRTALHRLRKTLGAGLAGDEGSVSLPPQSEVDARRFQVLLEPLQQRGPADRPDSAALSAALDLYRGDFLEGFSLPDAEAFEAWMVVEREHYRRLAVRGLTELSRRSEAQGDFGAALSALARALAFDPLQEDLQRAALRLHYLAGDRAGAIRRYETLRRLLDEEMGVPPMAETRALYDAIITDSLTPSPAERGPGPERARPRGRSRAPAAALPQPAGDAGPLPFTGRSREMDRMQSLRGGAGVILIEGEAGIGKTRLAEEFARACGGLVLSGAAHDQEQSLPYQPIVDALRGLLARPDWPGLESHLSGRLLPVWRTEVGRLVPELLPAVPVESVSWSLAAPASDESRLWEGVHQLLAALAEQQPVLLWLDDLHWADAATLGLLSYLARRRPAGSPIALLATARPAGPRSRLAAWQQALTRAGRLERVTLAPLARAETAALAHRLSPRHGEALAEWLNATAEGNPYILAELVRYAAENRLLAEDGSFDASALSGSPVVPQTVYSLIQSRLVRLSEGARRVLDAGVAIGREFELEVAARAAALSEAAAIDAVDELREAGLVDPQPADPAGRRWVFNHSLTMEVAYREVGEARHRLLHRRVAEALETVYRDNLDSVAGLLASHFAEGNAPERAAPYAFRAGQQAAALAAWEEAIAFYEQALAAPASRIQPVQVWVALGQAYYQSGASAQASEAFRTVLTLAEPGSAEAVSAQLLQVRALLPQGRFAEAIELAERIRAAGQPQSAVYAELLWGTALSLEGADLDGAAEHLRKAESLAAQAGGSGPDRLIQLAQAKFELGNVAAQQGDLAEAIARYESVLETARAIPRAIGAPWLVLAHNNLAYHRHLIDPRDPAASQSAAISRQLAAEHGMLDIQTYLLSTAGEIALARGELEAAEKYFAEGLALAEQISHAERVAGLTANLGRVANSRGETALAVHRLSTALAQADALGVHHLRARIRLWLAPLLPPAEARARLAEARTIAEAGRRRGLLDEIGRQEQGGSGS